MTARRYGLSRRDLILGSAALGVATVLPLSASAEVIGGRAFGTAWRLVSAPGGDLTAARRAIEAVIADIDAMMSPFRADSDLSRFNRSLRVGLHFMPHEVNVVAGEARDIERLTDGAFDPTVGPTVARFGFGPIVGKTGAWWDVPEGAGGIIKGAPGLTLDLCGIAKGHALDRIVAALNALSIRDSLIELGGEVAALGRHPEGRDWHVAIEDPLADGFVARHIVAPRGRALATSGHRARGLRGRWRSTHIIDPARDRPVDNGIASVTVLDETAMRADALATALCAMPAANTTVFAEKQGITALFVHDDGAETQTGDFAGHIIA